MVRLLAFILSINAVIPAEISIRYAFSGISMALGMMDGAKGRSSPKFLLLQPRHGEQVMHSDLDGATVDLPTLLITGEEENEFERRLRSIVAEPCVELGNRYE